MEPYRGPVRRRALLPAEVELCNTLGLTVDDYYYFLDQANRYTGERGKEYELIPEVNADVTVRNFRK